MVAIPVSWPINAQRVKGSVTQKFKISDMKKKNYKRFFNLFIKDEKKNKKFFIRKYL
jgi:hypothetical protein